MSFKTLPGIIDVLLGYRYSNKTSNIIEVGCGTNDWPGKIRENFQINFMESRFV